MKLKVDRFLFIGVLFLSLIVLSLLMISPEASYYQTTHLQFNSLMTSGETSNDHSFYNFIYCFGMVWVYLGSLLLSTRHLTKNKRNKIQILMVSFCLGYLCLLSLLIFSNIINDSYFYLGFPRNTAIMLYSIGFSPLFLSFVYVRYFDILIITEASFKNFQKQIKSQNI